MATPPVLPGWGILLLFFVQWLPAVGDHTYGYRATNVKGTQIGRKVLRRQVAGQAVQCLTDNGSAYTAHDTRKFARELNLEPCTTAVSSPQSNGMAERFVKTMKEDYISIMPKPNVRMAAKWHLNRSMFGPLCQLPCQVKKK